MDNQGPNNYNNGNNNYNNNGGNGGGGNGNNGGNGGRDNHNGQLIMAFVLVSHRVIYHEHGVEPLFTDEHPGDFLFAISGKSGSR